MVTPTKAPASELKTTPTIEVMKQMMMTPNNMVFGGLFFCPSVLFSLSYDYSSYPGINKFYKRVIPLFLLINVEWRKDMS